MFLVGGDDRLDERVTDDIPVAEEMEGDAGSSFQGPRRLNKAARLVLRKIDLGAVPGDDALRSDPDTGEEHEHLLGGGVLRLVEDDEGLVERAPAHVGKRGDLDDVPVESALDLLGLEHVVEGVVEGAQVGKDLLLQLPRQESERLARLDRGTGEDDAADLLRLEGGDRLGDGEVGLAGTGGSDAEGDIVGVDGPHVIALGFRLGKDRRLARGALDPLVVEFLDGGFDLSRDPLLGNTAGMAEGEEEFIATDHASEGGHLAELGEDRRRLGNSVGLALDPHPSVAAGDVNMEHLLHAAQETLVTGMMRLEGAGVLEFQRGGLAVGRSREGEREGYL